jgi:hydrogenase nickel incorporation protein HypB
MCRECGCGVVGEVGIGGKPDRQVASPVGGFDQNYPANAGGPTESAAHSLARPHAHEEHSDAAATRTVAIQADILEKNDRLAERNRGYFKAKGLLVLNMLSSPGSGKTTLIRKTAEALQGKLRVGVIVGDLATDNDAAQMREAGLPVVQVTTGNVCHLEAEMVAKAAGQMNLDELDLLIIENVGNLVCPAAYDLGEDLRVVLLSTTEGEDKPLKYPPAFHSANVAIVTKWDLAAAAGFDNDRALRNLRRISHHAEVMELSARTGEGMREWARYLAEQHQSQTAPR